MFVGIFKANPVVSTNLLASGLWFYGYNELATMTLKKTEAVTQSVAYTANRVIAIVGRCFAIVLGELGPHDVAQICGIGIGDVVMEFGESSFTVHVIDQLLAKKHSE